MANDKEKDGEQKVAIEDEILGDPTKLEDVNMFFFDSYEEEQKVEIQIVNDKDKQLYEERESAAKMVQDSLTRKEEMLKKLEDRFGDSRTATGSFLDDKEDELAKRRAAQASASSSSAGQQSTTQQASSSFTGAKPAYGYSGTTQQQTKTILQTAEERSSKFSDRAIKTARENFSDQQKRKRKRSKVDKLLPKHSKRRKTAIVASAILIETVASGLFFIQALAKHQLHAKILGGLDEKAR